jgi:hypothetical protein
METLISGAVSFFLFHFATHPNSKINKKLSSFGGERRAIKRVQFFPRVNIEARNKRIHIHHWMIFTPLFIALQTVGKNFGQADLFSGFMLGGILQGLMYNDSFKFIHHNKDYKDKITSAAYHKPHRFIKKFF